jgi:uncharacterized protein (UPF0332 family)
MFDWNRPIISKEEMKEHSGVIKKVHKEFTKSINKVLKKQQGICDQHDINQAIEKAKKKSVLTENENNIVEGFYDMYVAMWANAGGDRESVEQLIFSKILK